MDALTTPDVYASLTKSGTLKIHRLIPSPVDNIWAYLTESDLRRKWLASGVMEMRNGASFELIWRNEELSDTPSHRPSGFSEEQRMNSRITECIPFHKLDFTWGDSGTVSFELHTHEKQTLLTVTHSGLNDHDYAVTIAAGWHMHLDILVNRVTDTPPPPFWEGWSRLKMEYEKIFSDA